MKTLTLREFFRQPTLVQDMIARGEHLAVARRRHVIFEVHPPATPRTVKRPRRSVGKLSHLPLQGNVATPLPPDESWR